MDSQSKSYEKVSIKWTIIKRTVVRRTFFVSQMNFLSINNLYKTDTFTKQFSRKKTYIFFEKLLYTMFYSLVCILNNVFNSVFCPLNYFDWFKKFKIYRNLESATSTMIHTFSNYRTFLCTFRKRWKALESFT